MSDRRERRERYGRATGTDPRPPGTLPPVPRSRPLLAVLLALALLVAACGGSSESDPRGPEVGVKGEETEAAQDLGFPAFATKNTTRVGGGDPVANAAAVARAVYPGRRAGHAARRRSRSSTASDWRAGVAAAVARRRSRSARRSCSAEDDELPAGDAGRARRARPDRLARGRRRAGHARRRRARGRGAEDDRRHRQGRVRARRARSTALSAAARGRTSDRVVDRRQRARRPRDARRGLGGEVRRPGALHRAATSCRAATREALAPPPAAEDLRARRREGRLREGRARAAPARHGQAHRRRGSRPGRQRRSRSRATSTARSAGASSTRATAWCSSTPSGRSTRPPPRRCRASGTYGPILVHHGRREARRARSRATCSTSSRATAGTRYAGSTITAGSSGTRRPCRSPSSPGSTHSSRSPPSRPTRNHHS